MTEALLVPPVAFLHDPARWNLVVFLEKLPEISSFMSASFYRTVRIALDSWIARWNLS